MTPDPPRPSIVRFLAGYGAIACAFPYLALKLVWLTGGTLGVVNPALMRDSTMTILNAVTATMDVIAILLALAFTHNWGLRVPGWLLLPPMWVATGLLARFVLGVPVAALVGVLARGALPRIAGGPVEGWVYVLVYIEFAGMGVGLALAFLLHANARWPDVFQATPHRSLPGSTTHVQVALAKAFVPAAMLLGLLHLMWAAGAPVGLPGGGAGSATAIGSIVASVDAVQTIAAGTGVMMLVIRTGGTAAGWLPIAMAWSGTGFMFGWGLWQMINVLGETALVRGAEGRTFVNLVALGQLIVGLVLGWLMLFELASRDRPRRTTHQ